VALARIGCAAGLCMQPYPFLAAKPNLAGASAFSSKFDTAIFSVVTGGLPVFLLAVGSCAGPVGGTGRAEIGKEGLVKHSASLGYGPRVSEDYISCTIRLGGVQGA